jgi:hypothetical protein
MAREINTQDDYQSKLLKLIPSEVVGAYMVIQGVIPKEETGRYGLAACVGLSCVAAALLAAIPFLLKKLHHVDSGAQIVATSVAFIVWVYSLGGPFLAWGPYLGVTIYQPWIGLTLLVLWTTLVPGNVGGDSPPVPPPAVA